MRVGGRPRKPRRKFGRNRFAEYDRPCRPRPGDTGRISDRMISTPDRRIVFRRQISGIQHVLHTER